MTFIGKTLPYPKIILALVLFSGVLLGVHFLLPYVVNTQSVKGMLIGRASKAYGGEIEYSTFKPALLPWPHVKITRGLLTDGEKNTLHIPEAAIYMKLWPLLAGKVRVDRIKLVRPLWTVDPGRFDIPVAGPERAHPSDAPRAGVLAPLIAFLGNAEGRIVDGRLDLHRDGRSIIRISRLTTRITASGGRIRLKLRGRTSLSDDLAFDGDLDLDNLNGRGHLKINRLQSRLLPAIGLVLNMDDFFQTEVDLDADVSTIGLERFQARFSASTPRIMMGQGSRRVTVGAVSMRGGVDWDGRHIGVTVASLRSADPGMKWSGSFSSTGDRSMGDAPIQLFIKGTGLEIYPIRERLLKLFRGQPVLERVLDIVREGKIPALAVTVSAHDWQELKRLRHLHAEGELAGGRIVVPSDLFDLEQVSGHLVIAGGRLTAEGVSARQGGAFASRGELTLGLYDGSRVFSLDTLVDADAAEIPNHLRRLVRSGAVRSHLQRLPAITGRATGRLVVGDHLDRLSAVVTAKARIDAGETALDIVGDVRVPPDHPPSARFFTKGRLGPAVSDWLRKLAKVPPVIAPRTPLTVSGAEVAMAPSGRIRLNGRFEWDDGAHIGAALTYSGGDFHLQQLRIRDGVSDALISFRHHPSGRSLDLGFSGHLETSSLRRLGDLHQFKSGSVQGRCRVHIDREKRDASLLNGRLFVRDLTYHHGEAGAIHINEGAVSGQGGGFDIPRASLTWDGSTMVIAAGGLFTPPGVELQGTVRADTLHTRKIIAVFDPDPDPSSQKEPRSKVPALQVAGRLTVAVDRLIHGRYHLSSVQALIDVRDRQTNIDVVAADLCGIQIPGQVRISDGMTRLVFTPHAEGSSLKEAGSCVADHQYPEKLTGILNLKGRLSTRGRNREALLANLNGMLEFKVEKGRISNIGSAGVFTNLLSYLSVNQYIQGDLPDLRANDFVYNRIQSRWVFENGAMRVEEGVLKSNAVNMVAEGRYDLSTRELDLLVLVSPLTTVDWIVDHIPVVGHILQGTLVAIPVRVKGPGADPAILPLSPKAIGTRLGGILKRTLKAPVRIIEPLLKDAGGQEPGEDRP